MATGALGTAGAAEIDAIHFLIPGGAGGGWDGTARGTGEALTKAGLVSTASFENMSGGGGGKAIAHLIETADKRQGTLMVNSTQESPVVNPALYAEFPGNGQLLPASAAEATTSPPDVSKLFQAEVAVSYFRYTALAGIPALSGSTTETEAPEVRPLALKSKQPPTHVCAMVESVATPAAVSCTRVMREVDSPCPTAVGPGATTVPVPLTTAAGGGKTTPTICNE